MLITVRCLNVHRLSSEKVYRCSLAVRARSGCRPGSPRTWLGAAVIPGDWYEELSEHQGALGNRAMRRCLEGDVTREKVGM